MDFSEDLDDDAEEYSEYEENVQSKRDSGSRHRRVGGGSLDLASIATLSEDSVGGSPPTKRLDSILV